LPTELTQRVKDFRRFHVRESSTKPIYKEGNKMLFVRNGTQLWRTLIPLKEDLTAAEAMNLTLKLNRYLQEGWEIRIIHGLFPEEKVVG
jgi:hypothetical protein